jgi:hypothetical protein
MDCTCSVWSHQPGHWGFLKKWRLDMDDFLLGKHCWTVWWDDGRDDLGRLGWGSKQASLNMKGRQLTDWWFGTMDFYDFPFSWEWNNYPNWLYHIFQRGRSSTNQFFEWGQALEFLAMAGLSRINREMKSKQPNCVGPQWIWFEQEKVGPWISEKKKPTVFE